MRAAHTTSFSTADHFIADRPDGAPVSPIAALSIWTVMSLAGWAAILTPIILLT